MSRKPSASSKNTPRSYVSAKVASMSAIDLCCCRQILRGQVSGYGPLSLCLTTDFRDHGPHPDSPRTRESAALPPLVPRMHLLAVPAFRHREISRAGAATGFSLGHVVESGGRNEHVSARKRADRGQEQNRLKCAHSLWPDKVTSMRRDGTEIYGSNPAKQKSPEVMSYLIPQPMKMCRPLQTYRTEPKGGTRMTPAQSQRSAYTPGH